VDHFISKKKGIYDKQSKSPLSSKIHQVEKSLLPTAGGGLQVICEFPAV